MKQLVGGLLGLVALVSVNPACSQALNGAGSTFINPVMTHWTVEFAAKAHQGVNYQPVGSGGGINLLIHKAVDFAGSDAPMTAQELAEAGEPVMHLPVVIGAVVVGYTTPGVPDQVKLNGLVLADIFLGRVQYWDDPRITRLNPGVKLPHVRLSVVHRSDGSGTTFIFSDYLSKVCPEWKLKVSAGKSVAWPAGFGGKGNAGVANLLETRPGSIGYVELAYALQNHIKFAAIQNAKGKFIVPSSITAGKAAEGVRLPANLCASLINTANVDGYPITGFSWLIVRTSGNKPVMKRFLAWVISTGRKDCVPLSYANIPISLMLRESHLIATLK